MTRSVDTDHDGDELHPTISGGSRRWVDAWALWLVAVGAQALVLFLLAQYQLQQLQTLKMREVVDLIARGELASARRYAAQPDYFFYPTEILVQFALVGVAVILLAWTGRRALAFALPVALVAVSIGPAYVSQGPTSVTPIGEGGDWSLWASLALLPGSEQPGNASTWPLLLGVVVQTVLLLLPLIAAPTRQPAVPLSTAVGWAAIPATFVAVIALATLEFPSANQLYTVPLAGFFLTLLAGAIATGAGGTWQRLGAAVAAPAFIAPIVMPIDTTNTRQDVALGLMVAAVSALLVLAILALPSLTRRATHLDAPTDEGMVPLAP
jgi:hypothetical protein